MNWFSKARRPSPDWDAREQLKRISSWGRVSWQLLSYQPKVAMSPVGTHNVWLHRKIRLLSARRQGASVHQRVQHARACWIAPCAYSPDGARWWREPALELVGARNRLPPDWYDRLELPLDTSFDDGVKAVLASLADQATLTWPGYLPEGMRQSEPEEWET
jgi:hypothetical protein